MKTIFVGNSRTRNTWTVLLMAALSGLYYYRKNGGSIRNLIGTAFSGLSTVREKIGQVAPSVVDRIPSVIGSRKAGDVSSAYQPSTSV